MTDLYHRDGDADQHDDVAQTPRSSGALDGVLVVAFGVRAGLIPLIGPYFQYACTAGPPRSFPVGRWPLQLPASPQSQRFDAPVSARR